MKKIYALIAGLPAAIYGGAASAEITLPTAFDVSDVETLVGLVLTGLVVMWGARKIIKTVNRS